MADYWVNITFYLHMTDILNPCTVVTKLYFVKSRCTNGRLNGQNFLRQVSEELAERIYFSRPWNSRIDDFSKLTVKYYISIRLMWTTSVPQFLLPYVMNIRANLTGVGECRYLQRCRMRILQSCVFTCSFPLPISLFQKRRLTLFFT
jgi:hypothetical protein